mgnify:CR=1 FL=1
MQNVYVVLAPRGNHSHLTAAAAEQQQVEEREGGVVDKGDIGKKRTRVSKGAACWLDVRVFATTAECIAALLEVGAEIWATDLSQVSQAVACRSVRLGLRAPPGLPQLDTCQPRQPPGSPLPRRVSPRPPSPSLWA